MTDRENIRAYIEKLHKEHRGSEGDSIFRRALRTVLFYIDSLQEEPVSEVWHDANEEQPEEYRTVVVWNPIIMDGEVIARCAEVYKGRIWAYIEDLLPED